MTGRDSGRSRVYAAQRIVHVLFDNAERGDSREAEFFGARLTLPPEAKFASVDSLQRYVDRVLALARACARWPERAGPVTVRARKGHTAAHYERRAGRGVIAVPDGRWAMRELVVLHELAHHFDPGEGGAHGSGFQKTYAELAGAVMGVEVAYVLRVAFAEEGAG